MEKELRIGNYYDGVRGIEQLTNAEALQEIESYPEKFKPIPLTEEWLLKLNAPKHLAGFELITHGRIRYSNDYGENLNADYVHELQNLVFAINGEELFIK